MKSIATPFLLVACLLSMAGCFSTATKVDSGPISARTFNFVNTGKPLPEYADKDQHIHALFQGAITQSLARRHVSRVEQGGDITVAYLIITGNNVSTTMIDDYFGYPRDALQLLDKAHDKYASQDNYFEAGTLLIDLIDSKSGKVLNRGYATRSVQRGISAEAQTARVSEAVEEILAPVRFKP